MDAFFKLYHLPLSQKIVYLKIMAVGFALAIALSDPNPFVVGAFLSPFFILFGIAHGAVDHVLEKISQPGFTWLRFLLFYLSMGLATLLVWLILPALAFWGFILISAYHFGQTQLVDQNGNGKWIDRLDYVLWGSMVLSVLFSLHIETFADYIFLFDAGFNFSLMGAEWWITGGLATGWLLVHGLKVGWSGLIRQLPDFIALILIFYITDLLVGFFIFFVFWHSVPAIEILLRRVKPTHPNARFTWFFFQSWPFTAVAVGGLAGMMTLAWLGILPANGVVILFIGISALTMPHMITIERFYRRTSF